MHLIYFLGSICSGYILIHTHRVLYRLGKQKENDPEEGEPVMVWIYMLAAIVAIFLFAFLVAALFNAEKF